MKRKKRTNQNIIKSKPKWKKMTGGIHIHGDQTVRKGEYLYAEEWELNASLIKQGRFKLITPVKRNKKSTK